jgi:hypothetical protein
MAGLGDRRTTRLSRARSPRPRSSPPTRASGPVRCEAMGVFVCVTRHVIMAASANASVTRMKTAAVLSDMSHIWSPDLSGPPH